MSYMDFVKDRILTPLNMTSTTFSESEASQDGKLSQAWTAFGRRIPFWMPDDRVLLNAGPGGIISNAVDMVSFFHLMIISVLIFPWH